MADKKQKKSGKNSYIFTRETLGMTVLLFSAIVLFILFTRSVVLSNFGAAICTFMYGAFGYGVYFVMALLVYLGVWLVFEKKIRIKAGVALSISACVLSFFLLFHAVTTRNMSIASYGDYLNANYMSAANGWSGYTFGGAICGLIVYPVAKLTTFIGAYVIFSLLFLLCGYWVFRTLFKGRIVRGAAKEAVKETQISEVEYDDSRSAEPAPAPVADHLYSVNENNEIVTNRVISQPVAQPVAQSAPQPVEYNGQAQPEQDDDKFSQRNLGRKILFENGEFAAESYRRNMIFNEDSYFNHPVRNESDYLSGFSSNPSAYKSTAATQSYTENYQEEVINQPASETPSNYVYGETPVQNLDNNYNQPQNTQPSAPDYPTYNEAATNYAESIRQTQPVDESPAEPPRQYVQPEPQQSERNIFAERVRNAQQIEEPVQSEEYPVEIEPAAEPPKEESKPSNTISSLFTADSIRGNDSVRVSFGREEQRTAPREEVSKQDLFDDDDVDLGEDRFGVSSRNLDSRADRTERTDRSERSLRDEPPATPATPEREVGFAMPVSERRSAPVEPPKPEPPKEEKPKHVWKKYVCPPLDLLNDYPEFNNVNTGEIEENKRIIVDILDNFKIACEVTNVTIAPALTRYDVSIFDKTKTRSALGYNKDIALALMKNNVNTYLNYAKGVISIDVPNTNRATVGLKSMLSSSKFINSKPNSLTFGLGKDIDGEVVCPDITKMPHLLVAGTTGSGKSICLNTLLISLLYKYGPEELRLILVDPKQAEFIPYADLPHLMINEILYEIDKVIKALNWAVNEMERRYALFKEMTVSGTVTKTLDEYNSHLPEGEEKLPKILIVLDEFADLMSQNKKDIETRIIRLAQKSRACGIHLILATQRPSVNCITGLIKSNLPTRIGFRVNSHIDSSTIFDVGGAEKLLGKGDMYYRSVENPDLVRIQGCFIDSPEVQKVTEFVKENNETYFDKDATDFINKVEEPEAPAGMGGGDMGEEGGDAKIDETFIKALKFCVMSNQASVSMIQRRFPVGYIKACKIIDWMENMNYVTQSEGSKPRKVLMTKEEFTTVYGEVDD